jgi:hypothetical protein
MNDSGRGNDRLTTDLHVTHAPRLKRMRQLTKILDGAISIPGTKQRFGLDPILGLIPGGGDTVSAALSGYIIIEAALMGLPREALIKMVMNYCCRDSSRFGRCFRCIFQGQCAEYANCRKSRPITTAQCQSRSIIYWFINYRTDNICFGRWQYYCMGIKLDRSFIIWLISSDRPSNACGKIG